jgi:hypothetical protein
MPLNVLARTACLRRPLGRALWFAGWSAVFPATAANIFMASNTAGNPTADAVELARGEFTRQINIDGRETVIAHFVPGEHGRSRAVVTLGREDSGTAAALIVFLGESAGTVRISSGCRT